MEILQTIPLRDRVKWNEIVHSFDREDIYYTNEYVQSLLLEQEGEAVLFYFRGEHSRTCYPMLILDIAKDRHFTDLIEPKTWYDLETPYGYGGPLFQGTVQDDAEVFRKSLESWCRDNRIISQFVRFHPVLENATQTRPLFDEIRYMHHTIYIDTGEENRILENMDSKNRNMVRKAKKNGVTIQIEEDLHSLEEFKTIYTQTMDHHHAGEMYYFSDQYYEFLQQEMKGHVLLAKAVYEGKTIAASLFFYNNQMMHYHLSGTLREYRHLASTNLLLYEVACYAAGKGIKKLHLGGGLAEDDSLYGFKKQFNKHGVLDFYIGKNVFNSEAYRELCDARKKADPGFEENNGRMIQYRA